MVIKRNEKYIYSGGGLLGKIGSLNDSLTDKFLGEEVLGNLGKLGITKSNIGGIANTASTMVGGVLAGQNQTGVGNAMQSIGSLASNIPGVGGIIGAGVNLLGGITNAAFGSHLNQENINKIEGQVNNLNSFQSVASDYDALSSEYSNAPIMGYFSKDSIGSDGWFSNKAKNKWRNLLDEKSKAEDWVQRSLANNALNIANNTLASMEANYTAYGGPLTVRYSGLMSPFGNQFREGGGIHIKKKNRGKFTSYCGGKVTNECIQRGLHSSNPTTRKRANFARNARKWKHEDGGPLNPYSAGALVDAIYSSSNGDKFLGKPSHNYDFTISEEEANKLGYYPNERGHRDDRVKKSTHPTHPSRGKWNSFEEFRLTDKGMENPNYTLFGLVDGGQDPQAVMTYKGGVVLPEITVTPKESYIMNPYDNIKIFDKGGSLTNKKSSSRRLDNNYKEGEIYDVTEEEVKLLKELGYEFEYV